ncbi:hypothetical protein [Lysinibacillus sp. NPDC096212]|uniref:hypothetical protein n=1 Tax=unclassified Lysinibacillus TaxID=2636778 RepID=UPI003809EB9C
MLALLILLSYVFVQIVKYAVAFLLYTFHFTEQDVLALYMQFESKLMESLATYTDPIQHVKETVYRLRKEGIRIGSTTGYTDSMMEVVTHHAAAKGYEPDFLVTPTQVGDKGRPYPYMIFKNMEALDIGQRNKL